MERVIVGNRIAGRKQSSQWIASGPGQQYRDDMIDEDNQPADDMEMSLDELGRAYAKAVGLIPDAPPDDAKSVDDLAETDDSCEVSPKSILEAILFVGAPPDVEALTTRQIASWIRDVSPREIAQLVKELNGQYQEEGAAYRIETAGERVQMVLAVPFHSLREGFYGEVRTVRLSQQAIDVLAIVAWQQPITREQVSELRFRDCGGILSQLVRRGLLSVEPGEGNTKSRLYRTTDRFLELFGLESLEDLPQSADAILPDADHEGQTLT